MKRLKLDSHSSAIFSGVMPRGTWTLRSAISVNQAGAGFLGGTSRTIVYHQV